LDFLESQVKYYMFFLIFMAKWIATRRTNRRFKIRITRVSSERLRRGCKGGMGKNRVVIKAFYL